MQLVTTLSLLAGSILASTLTSLAASPAVIAVSAGAYDRHYTPVTFTLRPSPEGGLILKDEQGNVQQLQLNDDGTVSFILQHLPKGHQKHYTILPSQAPSASPELRLSRKNNAIDFSFTDRLLLRYHSQASQLPRPDIKPIFKRGGYLHPISSPSGIRITDDYPANHLHHHGIWWSWTKTEFDGRAPNFWEVGYGSGNVEPVTTESIWSGPVHAGFSATHRFIDLTSDKPTTALNETWRVTVHALNNSLQNYWMFDLISTQTCATSIPLKLPEYRYGGLGFRGHDQWNGKEHAFFLTSEGETDRIKAHATRARWCDISGKVNGNLAGITILGHSDNFRSPQPVRIHPTEPFFCFAPQQLGAMEITPGTPYVSRYRFILHDSLPPKTLLEQFYTDFVDPPEVTVQVASE